MQDNRIDNSGRRLIPVSKWNEFHPWPTVSGLRWLIFHAKTNGFEHCMRRVGRRLLIDEAEFFAWVDAQQSKAESRSKCPAPGASPTSDCLVGQPDLTGQSGEGEA